MRSPHQRKPEKKNPMTALKTILAAALVCAAIPSANAAFEPRKEPQFSGGVDLECAIVKTSDGYRKDADPIYKIVVALSLSPEASPTSLTVTHVSAGGNYYTRDEQYTKSNLTNTRGKFEYFWTGTMVKNSAYTMRGALWRNNNGGFYSENQFKGGTGSFSMLSKCHVQGD
jgi:hypothetical protein